MGNKVFLAKVSDPGLSLTGSEPQKTGFLSQTDCIETRWLHILEYFFDPAVQTGLGFELFNRIRYTSFPGTGYGSDPNTLSGSDLNTWFRI